MTEKTRNGGTWTEARFRGFITSALRGAFRRWQPKYDTLKKAYVDVRVNPRSGRMAKHFRCAKCKDAFPQKEVQVDHKVPIGSVETWDIYIEKLFCEDKNLQVLCKPCHKLKSKKETKKRTQNENQSSS